MGNQASVQISTSIDAEQRGEVVRAGTRLTGKVVVRVAGSVDGGKVSLSITGSEVCKVRSKHNKVTRSYSRSFLQVDINLSDMTNRKLKDTVLSFPFAVDLPDSLPSSTSYRYDSYNHLTMQYKVFARVGSFTNERLMKVHSAPLLDERVPCMIEPKTERIKSMGLVNMGTLSFGASVRDTHVGRSEALDISLSCRNDSTVDIKRVHIKVVELISWGNFPTQHFESSKVTLLELNDIDLPGLFKGRKNRSEVENRSSDFNQEANYEAIFGDLISGRNTVRLMIPRYARDTYQGSVVRINHYVKITLQTVTSVDNPSIKIPLRIGFPPEESAPEQRPQSSSATGFSVPPPAAPSAPLPDYDIQVLAQEEASQDLPEGEIPMASAVLLSDSDAVQAPMVSAPSEAIFLGGIASGGSYADVVPLAPPADPTLPNLHEEMIASVNDYDIIMSKLRDGRWISLFAALTPDEYGSIITFVNAEFDQPRVAAILVPHVNGGNNFTCAYLAAAVRSCAQWNRPNMVQRLLPACKDVATGHHLVRAELNEWEQIITASAFEEAIEASS